MTFTGLVDRCAAGDRVLFLRLAPLHTRPLGRMWNRAISRMADGPLYASLALALLLLGVPGASRFALLLAAGFALELPAYKLIKHRCRRPRPCHADLDRVNLLPVPDRHSFPSGHTAGAFVLAGCTHAVYPHMAALALGFAICVGYSRVYNRLHFPADTLAGAALGLLCAAWGHTLTHLLHPGGLLP